MIVWYNTAPYVFGEFQARVYPESKIIVEVFPSEAHNIKSVLYNNVEQVVKDNKVEIVLEKKPADDNSFFYYRYISVVFEVKDSYLEEPVIVGNEYQVSTAKQLRWIASRAQRGETFEGKIVKLMNDIDMENKSFSGIASGLVRDVNDKVHFAGTFDGNNKKIKNLKIDFTFKNDNYIGGAGLIGMLSDKGVVKNLIIESGYVEIFQWGGAIVGYNFGLIDRVENHAEVLGFPLMGGIAGMNCGKIINSTNHGAISGYSDIGGIAGQNATYSYIVSGTYEGIIKNSENNGDILGYMLIGKINGWNIDGTVEDNIENGTATDGVSLDFN